MPAKAQPPSAWEDRWNAPTLEALLAPLDENRHKQITALIDRISEYPGIGHKLIWHGVSWRWCLQMNLHTEAGEREFAYIVPHPETPTIWFPMSSHVVDRLPMRRLNRYIRDGIRSAKMAVDVHWAKWPPTAGTEVEHLMDLVKRLHKMYCADDATEPA